MFARVENMRIICAGGDGTAGWVLSVLDMLEDVIAKPPPVGVIPLGTGNDLARCLNWGGGYEGEDIGGVLQELSRAEVVDMDRWHIEFDRADPDAECDPIPLHIMNNYFSVGVDASIALRFHHERENHPERFNSR